MIELYQLEEFFDDDLSKSLLDLRIDRALNPQETLLKSLYNFDLESPEGLDRVLELLPILDPEILLAVYQEVFPGYPVDNLSPRIARIELRGYFMDYLEMDEGYERGRPEEFAETSLAAEPGEDSEADATEAPGEGLDAD